MGYAIGEFLCPGCGGIANVIIQAQPVGEHAGSAPAVRWWAPWRAWVSVELICQGPAFAPLDDAESAAIAAATEALPPGATPAEVFAAIIDAGALPAAPDDTEAWDHAGTSIDLLATGYRPVCLN